MKTRILTILLAGFVAAGLIFDAAPAVAGDDGATSKKSEKSEKSKKKMSAKERDIRRLLTLMGSAKLAKQTMKQMVKSYRVTMPQVPGEFWDDFLKEAKSEELIDLIVPIYDKHLTHKDIKALIEFYESPAGKRFLKVLPQITQESQVAGEKWGRELGERVMKRLQKKGYK